MKVGRLLIYLFFILLVSSPFLILPRVIKIRKISCSSQYGPCNHRISDAFEAFETKSLFQAKREVGGILASDSGIGDYSVHYKIPDLLEVETIERKAFFAIKSEGRENVSLIDSEGVVIAFQESVSLPTLAVGDDSPNVGEIVEGQTFFALTLLRDLFTLYSVNSGEVVNEGLVVDLSSGERVIFPLEGDRQLLMGSLSAILAKLKADNVASRIEVGQVEIDLRFKNPVIR